MASQWIKILERAAMLAVVCRLQDWKGWRLGNTPGGLATYYYWTDQQKNGWKLFHRAVWSSESVPLIFTHFDWEKYLPCSDGFAAAHALKLANAKAKIMPWSVNQSEIATYFEAVMDTMQADESEEYVTFTDTFFGEQIKEDVILESLTRGGKKKVTVFVVDHHLFQGSQKHRVHSLQSVPKNVRILDITSHEVLAEVEASAATMARIQLMMEAEKPCVVHPSEIPLFPQVAAITDEWAAVLRNDETSFRKITARNLVACGFCKGEEAQGCCAALCHFMDAYTQDVKSRPWSEMIAKLQKGNFADWQAKDFEDVHQNFEKKLKGAQDVDNAMTKATQKEEPELLNESIAATRANKRLIYDVVKKVPVVPSLAFADGSSGTVLLIPEDAKEFGREVLQEYCNSLKKMKLDGEFGKNMNPRALMFYGGFGPVFSGRGLDLMQDDPCFCNGRELFATGEDSDKVKPFHYGLGWEVPGEFIGSPRVLAMGRRLVSKADEWVIRPLG